jgi:glucokinase
MILAGDIGATNTRLGLFRDTDPPESVVVRHYCNRDHASFDAVLDGFLPELHGATIACLGAAGPVVDGRSTLTNVGWTVDSAAVAAKLGGMPVLLLNDVEATAHGIATLGPRDLLTLNPGHADQTAPAALIAAGTGLGEAVLYPGDSGRVVFASEAGHADFAPANPLQSELLSYLWPRFPHVSWDRVLSGPGLLLIYEFLRDCRRGEEMREIANAMRAGDPAAVIAEAAQQQSCNICVAALEVFTSIYGAEAGNLALRCLARAGVYVGGGIAPKIAAKLCEGTFMRSFITKDRMQQMLAEIPVYVVLNDLAALQGAARYAGLLGSNARALRISAGL